MFETESGAQAGTQWRDHGLLQPQTPGLQRVSCLTFSSLWDSRCAPPHRCLKKAFEHTEELRGVCRHLALQGLPASVSLDSACSRRAVPVFLFQVISAGGLGTALTKAPATFSSHSQGSDQLSPRPWLYSHRIARDQICSHRGSSHILTALPGVRSALTTAPATFSAQPLVTSALTKAPAVFSPHSQGSDPLSPRPWPHSHRTARGQIRPQHLHVSEKCRSRWRCS